MNNCYIKWQVPECVLHYPLYLTLGSIWELPTILENSYTKKIQMCTNDRVTPPGTKILTETFHPVVAHKKIGNFPSSLKTSPGSVKGGSTAHGGEARLDQISSVGSLLLQWVHTLSSRDPQSLTSSTGTNSITKAWQVSWEFPGEAWTAPAQVCVWEAAPPWLCPRFLMEAIEHLEVRVSVLESHPLRSNASLSHLCDLGHTIPLLSWASASSSAKWDSTKS